MTSRSGWAMLLVGRIPLLFSLSAGSFATHPARPLALSDALLQLT